MLNKKLLMSSPSEGMSSWFCVDFTDSTTDGSVTISSNTQNSFLTNLGTVSPGETIVVPKGSKLFMKGVDTVEALFVKSTSSNKWKFTGTNIRVSGNIQTLLGDGNRTSVGWYAFSSIFSYSESLVDAGALILPATILAPLCYEHMFDWCDSLTKAPELPATTLENYCYGSMFHFCTSLTKAPELPATILARGCYEYMFDGCYSLTKAPELPATTLAIRCYDSMFSGCDSLTKAPELLATTLAEGCYDSMFIGCDSLKYIKCMATDISASLCTGTWVRNVASSGTFVKNSKMSDWTTGENGIPSGWTVTNG